MQFDDTSIATLRMMARRSKDSKGSSVADRRAREKKPMAATDGRRARRTGRNTQLNLKVKPAFKDELADLAKAQNVGMAEMMEIILAQWKSSTAAKG